MTSYILYSFNSFLDLQDITSTAFSNGFFLIQNSSMIMNNSIFDNYGEKNDDTSDLSVFTLSESISLSIILVENSLFFGVSNVGNGSVKQYI